MTQFEFSIRGSLRRSWHIFTKHLWFFLLLSFVLIVLNVFSHAHHGVILQLIASVAGIVWAYVGISSVLAAVDGKESMLEFDALKLHLPTGRQFLKLIGVALLSFLIIGAGFIMLIIPGIYFLTRLTFSNFALVDRQGSVTQSMRTSWHMVKGDVFWTVLLGLAVAVGLILLGVLAAVIGVLITYPVAMIFLAILYRDISTHTAQAIVEQPKEVPPTPQAETPTAVV